MSTPYKCMCICALSYFCCFKLIRYVCCEVLIVVGVADALQSYVALMRLGGNLLKLLYFSTLQPQGVGGGR